jgi:hypothetical protein
MAIETASTLSGLRATIPTVSTAQSNIIVFMAFKPLGNVNTWNREIALQHSGASYPRVLLRLRGDTAYEGVATNSSNSTQSQNPSSTAVVDTWKRMAVRIRAADRLYVRAQGDASLSQSSVGDISPLPGSSAFDRFVVNTKFDASTFGEAARYAHFGYYLGDWTDQQIADFCAGTWNPANSSLVTTYWTGDSLTPSVGTGTLAEVGSNNTSIVADTGHGVPDYSGSAGITLQQVERGRGVLRGLGRGL